MREDEANRVSAAQVMCGLRHIWPEIVGGDPPIEPGSRIDEHLRNAGVWEEIDFADVAFSLDCFFDSPAPKRKAWKKGPLQQWVEFLGLTPEISADWAREIAPRLTFQALSEFIAQRTNVRTIGAVIILGRRCRAAGAFRTIQQIVAAEDRGAPCFGPSTPIKLVLKGRRLRRVWAMLRWMSEARLPPLRRTWVSAVCREVNRRRWAAATAAILFGTWLWALQMRPLIVGVGTLLVTSTLLAIDAIARRFRSPIPVGYRDFRSVALALATSE